MEQFIGAKTISRGITRARFPRTLQEAFGPYAELQVEKKTTIDDIIGWVSGGLVIVIVGLLVWGVV